MTNNTREHLSTPVEARFDRIDRRARKSLRHSAHSKRVRKVYGKRVA